MRSSVVLAGALLGAPAVAFADDDDFEIEIEATPEAPVAASESEDLRAVIAGLEARLAALEAPAIPEPAPEPERRRWIDGIDVGLTGYVQVQGVFSQLSEDEVTPDGGAFNQDRFLVRRGRLRFDARSKYVGALLEIDANTARGPFVSLRRAELSASLPGPSEDAPPYVGVIAGLSEIPFGYEIDEGHRARPFMERSTASLAWFRGEPDVGVTVAGGFGPLRYAVALQNGVPLDDRPNAVTTVFTKKKTVVGRVGFDASGEDLELAGGASFLSGTGFHAGTPARKATMTWIDANQNGLVTLDELGAVSGQAATPSSTFSRWAVGVDARFGIETPIGWTRLRAEATMATNLDRGWLVADPISTGYDLREFGWQVAFHQEITPYALVGFRADAYDPDADLFEARRGVFVATDAGVLTLSPLLGAQLPDRARLVVQYDVVIDHLGRDDRGESTDLRNNLLTVRTQVEF